MFGHDAFADPNFIPPPQGTAQGGIELAPDNYFYGLWYTRFEDSDWLMAIFRDLDNKMHIVWRMFYFDGREDELWGTNEKEKYSWYNLISNGIMIDEDCCSDIEKIHDSFESSLKAFLDNDEASFHFLELKCQGDLVWEKIVDEAPWYPIPDPVALACDDELK